MNKSKLVRIKEKSKCVEDKVIQSEELKSLASVDVVNIIANRRSDGYRLSPAAKRLLVMRKFQDDLSARDTALLIRVLNEIDALEDKQNGGVTGAMSFGWIDSTVKEVEH